MYPRDRLPPNFVAKETARIAALSNNMLVVETVESAAGDDYDGCFTRAGEATFSLLRDELKRRLVAVGFATEQLWTQEEEQ